jgi:hypothetical protein
LRHRKLPGHGVIVPSDAAPGSVNCANLAEAAHARHLQPDAGPATFPAGWQPPGYFSSRDRRLSASGLPPVWHVGQY